MESFFSPTKTVHYALDFLICSSFLSFEFVDLCLIWWLILYPMEFLLVPRSASPIQLHRYFRCDGYSEEKSLDWMENIRKIVCVRCYQKTKENSCERLATYNTTTCSCVVISSYTWSSNWIICSILLFKNIKLKKWFSLKKIKEKWIRNISNILAENRKSSWRILWKCHCQEMGKYWTDQSLLVTRERQLIVIMHYSNLTSTFPFFVSWGFFFA